MIRFAFAFLPLVFLATLLTAQSSSVVNYQVTSKFNGLKTENGKLFYTAHYGTAQPDTPYNIFVKLVDDQFQTLRDDRIKTGYNSSIEDVVGHKGGLIFYIKSGSDGITAYYDKNGRKVWQRKEEKDKNRYNEVKMRSLGDQGIAVAHHHKGDNKGFMVEIRDDDWNLKTSKGIHPESGKLRFEKIAANKGKVTVLARYQGGLFSGESGYRVATFDAKTQEFLYSESVSDDSDLFEPAELATLKDGSAFVAYYNNPTEERPESLNFVKLNGDGTEAFHTQLNYRDTTSPLNAIHPDPTLSRFRQPEFPYVNFHDVKQTGQGLVLLGESYYYEDHGGSEIQMGQKSAKTSTPPTTISILDYVQFRIGNDGTLQRIHRQKKPYKRIKAKGYLSSNAYHAADRMEKHNFFSYRFQEKFKGESEIVSYGWHNNMKYIGFSQQEDHHEPILKRIYLDEPVVEEQSGGGRITYDFIQEEDFAEANFRQYQNVLPHHKKGKIAKYDFDKKSGDLTVRLVDQSEAGKTRTKAGQKYIPGIPAQGFNGIKAFEKSGFHTFYFSEYGKGNTAHYVFHALDDGMQTQGRSVVQVPATARPAADAKINNTLNMTFQDAANQKWHFYRFNNQGRIDHHEQLALDKSSNKVMTGDPKLMAQKGGRLTMVQPYHDTLRQRRGVDILNLTAKHQVKWVKEHYAPEGNRFKVISATANNDRIGLIHGNTKSNYSTDFERAVSVWGLSDGKQLYQKSIEEEGKFIYPEYAQFNQKNDLRLTGIYFEGDNFDEKNSEGYFLQIYGNNGKEKVNRMQQWEEMRGMLESGSETDFLISGKTKVLIQNMVPKPDGGFQLIGELFQKSSGNTGLGMLAGGHGLGDRAFTIFDFIVFDCSANGELQDLYKIQKPQQSLILPEHMEHQRGLSLSYMLRDYEVFSYRKVLTESSPKLVYEITPEEEEKPNRLYQSAINKNPSPVATDASSPIPRPKQKGSEKDYGIFSDLQEFSEKMDKKLEDLGKDITKALKGTTRTFRYSRNQYQGMAIKQPGEVVVYQYDPASSSVFLEMKQME